jgi:hypothetical protein
MGQNSKCQVPKNSPEKTEDSKTQDARLEKQPGRCAEGPISKGQVPKDSRGKTQEFKTQDRGPLRGRAKGKFKEKPVDSVGQFR